MSKYSLEDIEQTIEDMKKYVKDPLVTQGEDVIDSIKSITTQEGLSGETNNVDFDALVSDVGQAVKDFGVNMDNNLESLRKAAIEQQTEHETANNNMAQSIDEITKG